MPPRKKATGTPTEESVRTSKTPAKKPKSTSAKKTSARATAKPKPLTTSTNQQSEEKIVARAITQPIAGPSDQVPRVARHSMNAMTCFVYGAVICLVGTIGIGLLLGFAVLPPLVAQVTSPSYSHRALLSGSDRGELQSPAASEQIDNQQAQEYGFYGILLAREESVLTVQELLPPLPLEGEEELTPTEKTFLVRITPQTTYTHQKPRAQDDLTSPLFSPVEGSLEELAPRVYVFVNTPDDPTTSDMITASHVLYSELSPFTE